MIKKKSNRTVKLGFTILFACIILITLFDNTAENEEILDSEEPSPISQGILLEGEEDKIQLNSQISETIADDILSSFETGDFFKNNWIPTLESTYQALFTLKKIGKLGVVNESLISNFILSQYCEQTGLFSDKNSNLINYSITKKRAGYSEIEATAYAVLGLEILNGLNLLSSQEQNQIIGNFKDAININDGGFCHR
ncbi:MAG: hypothetical protein ACTSWY_13800, partial [Promethearchaeota archaeon]